VSSKVLLLYQSLHYAHSGYSIVILKQVDSTNNYAMAKVHAGMAKHGDAWFFQSPNSRQRTAWKIMGYP
jgi:hypothetical protein